MLKEIITEKNNSKMTKKEIISEINKIKFSGKDVFLLVRNVREYDKYKKSQDNTETEDGVIKNAIKQFNTGSFVEYAITTFQGKGIEIFSKKYNLKLEKSLMGDAYKAEDFYRNVKIRNLILASKVTGQKISKTLLRKIYDNRVADADLIVKLAKEIQKNYDIL